MVCSSSYIVLSPPPLVPPPPSSPPPSLSAPLFVQMEWELSLYADLCPFPDGNRGLLQRER